MPTDHQGGKGGFTTHLPGIFQALIATALGTGLLPAVKIAWEYFVPDRHLWDWAQGLLANLTGAVVLIPAFWLLTRPLSRIASRRMRATPRPKGDRLSIYVARFGEDAVSAEARHSVIASIRNELVREQVEVLPAGVRLTLTDGVSYEDAANEATNEARSLLRKKRGDLLIWGQVHAFPEKPPVIELRFVSLAQDAAEGQRFAFTPDKLTLEANFGPEIGTALAAVAVTLAAPARDSGKYRARTLIPVADRLGRLTRKIPPSIHPEDRARLFFSYGLIQSTIGEQSGEDPPLHAAVAAFREALKEYPQEHIPLEWARTMNYLGIALRNLGERESGTARLEEAVSTFRDALREYRRERALLDCAWTMNNLGTALWRLGERESGTARLEEAVSTFREALNEYTRERTPLLWAWTMSGLGIALWRLGERESSTARLEEAVAAIREALKERTRERVPLAWATEMNNLGGALQDLGEYEGGTTRLEEAAAAIREALKENTQERLPLDWAATMNNLGNALQLMGERETGTARLEEAVAAYRKALKERTRERVPLDWAMTMNNLASALHYLGERESGTARLEEAVATYREALKENTQEHAPLEWARTTSHLGIALRSLGERESGTARLEEAVHAIESARSIYRNAGILQYETHFETSLQSLRQVITRRSTQ
jgi:tetratricopeptide (TPR) repeat protein